VVNGTQPGSLGAEVLAAASAALSATSMALAADNLFYDSSAKVRTLQAAGGTLFCLCNSGSVFVEIAWWLSATSSLLPYCWPPLTLR
jgi:hypothetical protein